MYPCLPNVSRLGSHIGVDFAGPLRYQLQNKSEGKEYLVMYLCSLPRGVHLELLKSQATEEFLRSLERFITLRIVYSNWMTFKATARVNREDPQRRKAARYTVGLPQPMVILISARHFCGAVRMSAI